MGPRLIRIVGAVTAHRGRRSVADLERVTGHIGTGDTAQTPTEQQWEYCTMGESLMQRRRVKDEVFRYVNFYQQGRKWRYLTKKPRLTTCQQPR